MFTKVCNIDGCEFRAYGHTVTDQVVDMHLHRHDMDGHRVVKYDLSRLSPQKGE